MPDYRVPSFVVTAATRQEAKRAAAQRAKELLEEVIPLNPIPPATQKHDYVTGLPSSWQIAQPFTAKPTIENGAVKIVTPAPSSSSDARFSRDVFYLTRGEGSELWLGGSWLADTDRLDGSRLLSATSYYPPAVWRLGVWGAESGNFEVVLTSGSGSTYVPLIQLPSLPSGEWFDLAIHAKLSQGAGLTEAYLNGQKVGEAQGRNMLNPNPVNVTQHGLAYYNFRLGEQTVFFDNAWVS